LTSVLCLQLVGAALLGAAVPLWLFFRLRSEFNQFSQFTRKAVTEQELMDTRATLEIRLAELEMRIAAFDDRRQQDADWLAQAESLNLNRRGQVLRLHRRGESPSSIASALRLAPGEVKLIIKVFELGQEKSGSGDEV
jgi:hypothetical protein